MNCKNSAAAARSCAGGYADLQNALRDSGPGLQNPRVLERVLQDRLFDSGKDEPNVLCVGGLGDAVKMR
jgi:hypothetical protein